MQGECLGWGEAGLGRGSKARKDGSFSLLQFPLWSVGIVVLIHRGDYFLSLDQSHPAAPALYPHLNLVSVVLPAGDGVKACNLPPAPCPLSPWHWQAGAWSPDPSRQSPGVGAGSRAVCVEGRVACAVDKRKTSPPWAHLSSLRGPCSAMAWPPDREGHLGGC